MEYEPKEKCHGCGCSFHFGAGRYDGRAVPGWKAMLCGNCARDREFPPIYQDNILAHLHREGIKPQYSKNGFLLVPGRYDEPKWTDEKLTEFRPT